MIISKINYSNINTKNYSNRNKQIVPMYNNLKSDCLSFKKRNEEKDIFKKVWSRLTKNNVPEFSDFKIKNSILKGDGSEYADKVMEYAINNYNEQEQIRFFNHLYKEQMKTKEAKEQFRYYFRKYLTEEKPQQNAQVKQTSQAATQKPTANKKPTQVATSQKTTASQKPAQVVIPKETKTYTKEELLEEFEKLEKEDVPNFVAKIANGTRDTQYNLVEILRELEKKHKKLLENDPKTLYEKDLYYNEELKQKIEIDIEVKFRKEGRKYDSTDIIKERIKVWKQMEKDAGFEDYEPATLRLGQKLYVLEKQMKEQNVSFVQKKPEQFASDDEKWKYVSNSIHQITKNEASAMEALDVFEKYGERRFIDDKTSVTSLEVIETKVSIYIDEILSKGKFKSIYHTKESIELTNALLQRFVQVHSKYATNQVDSRSYPDEGNIGYMFSKYRHVENKETMLMMINAMKDLAVDKDEYTNLKYVLKHFDPMLYEAINENDLQDIEKAFVEFGKAVENLPEKYEMCKN